MTFEELIKEAQGLGKGLGSAGAKISKSMGLPGVDVSTNAKPLPPGGSGGAPGTGKASSGAEGTAGLPPEGPDPIDTTPEVVEELPEPEPMVFDRLGSPDKYHLRGHIVKWGGKDHVLGWDDDFEVYKVVDQAHLE